MTIFKAGDFVRLNQKAIKNFYGTNRNTEMFMIAGDFTNDCFQQYVGCVLGFEDGKNAGLITGSKGCDDSWYVTFFDSLNGKWIGHYYNTNDLDKVGD